MKRIFVYLTILIFLSTLSISCEKKNLPPTCEINSPVNGSEYDVGEVITISAEADDQDGSISEVRFYINNIGVSSSSSFPYTYKWNTSDEEDGIQKIKVIAKDDDGTSISDEIAVLLNPGGDPPVASFSANKTSITEGESIQFTDQSANEPTTWSWDFGDGSTSSSQSPSYSYSSTGNYNVSLTATNSYGSDTETKTNYVTVATSGGETGTISDYDGNTYNTIKIGTQTWMAENLKATHYANGTEIPLVDNTNDWDNLGYTDKAMVYYDNSSTNANTYGALYTWAAVMNGANTSSSNPSNVQGVCPSGWHLPSDAEWTELIDYLGSVVGGKMKESGTTHWNSPNADATNESGFTALPGGGRGYRGRFDLLGLYAYFWSSTESDASNAWSRELYYGNAEVSRYYYLKDYGFSARCIKD